MRLKIGDRIWIFDENRRVYAQGKPTGSPLYHMHFRELTISGETARTWTAGHVRLPKNGSCMGKIEGRVIRVYTSSQEVERQIWLNTRADLGQAIYSCPDPEKLMAISALLGLPPPAMPPGLDGTGIAMDKGQGDREIK